MLWVYSQQIVPNQYPEQKIELSEKNLPLKNNRFDMQVQNVNKKVSELSNLLKPLSMFF